MATIHSPGRFLMFPLRRSSSDSPVKYLYIHMELCDTKTLRAWIDEKNMQDPKKPCKRREEGLGVALQIVNGVEHIHSKTLIHRDLKVREEGSPTP